MNQMFPSNTCYMLVGAKPSLDISYGPPCELTQDMHQMSPIRDLHTERCQALTKHLCRFLIDIMHSSLEPVRILPDMLEIIATALESERSNMSSQNFCSRPFLSNHFNGSGTHSVCIQSDECCPTN